MSQSNLCREFRKQITLKERISCLLVTRSLQESVQLDLIRDREATGDDRREHLGTLDELVDVVNTEQTEADISARVGLLE
jgi:hypothetical protein